MHPSVAELEGEPAEVGARAQKKRNVLIKRLKPMCEEGFNVLIRGGGQECINFHESVVMLNKEDEA